MRLMIVDFPRSFGTITQTIFANQFNWSYSDEPLYSKYYLLERMQASSNWRLKNEKNEIFSKDKDIISKISTNIVKTHSFHFTDSTIADYKDFYKIYMIRTDFYNMFASQIILENLESVSWSTDKSFVWSKSVVLSTKAQAINFNENLLTKRVRLLNHHWIQSEKYDKIVCNNQTEKYILDPKIIDKFGPIDTSLIEFKQAETIITNFSWFKEKVYALMQKESINAIKNLL